MQERDEYGAADGCHDDRGGYLRRGRFGYRQERRVDGGDGEGRGSVSTHVRGELLDPSGDYFATDHTAYFLRWEVLLAF